MKSLRRQAGVALITAVLIVALATILAVSVGFKGYLGQRRTATTFALDQAYQVALGGEAWASDALQRDITQSQGGGGRQGPSGGQPQGGTQGPEGKQDPQGGGQTDDFTDVWATPIPPIPVDGGEFEGMLEDMQGRFNLNNLVMIDQTRTFVVDPNAVARLERLLELVKIDKKWANLIADFIDSDANPQFPDGAEDPAYTGLNPPYRTANMPITRTSELLAVNGFGQQNFRRLEPFVAALPAGTKINLCTAPAEVLDSLLGVGQSQYTLSRESTAKQREISCFPTVEFFNKGLKPEESTALAKAIGTTSNYFQSTIFVTIGTTQFTLYSLLYRNEMGMVRPTLRSFGTP